MSAYYHTIYLLLLTAITLFVVFKYRTKPQLVSQQNKVSLMPVICVCIIYTVFIGLRDPYSPYFGDSQAYSFFYDKAMGDSHEIDWSGENPIFYFVMYGFASLDIPVSLFYFFIAILYYGGMCFACIKFFKYDAFAAFAVCLAAFSTYSYSVNGIKAGVAASMFLVALCLNDSKVKFWPLVFLALSIGFHHSMRVPVVAFFLCKYITSPRFYTGLWIFCFLVAALHITFFQQLFSSFGDEKAVAYLDSDNAYIRYDVLGGFRIDFIIYSVIPIIIGYYGVYKKHIQSTSYMFILNLYTFINSIWLLCIYASFTNRIAYLSWSMYPIVLAYPLLREEWGNNKFKLFSKVTALHLAFTLFMNFIY